ncbi:MAG: TM2 domain-containing protein [Phycisphaerales bacterium]|nr:TM2 domain-containing protein [Phycisphaerales bacterium]
MNEHQPLEPMSPLDSEGQLDSEPLQIIPFIQEEVQQKKLLCGIFGIIMGALGIHKFILGYTSTGLIMLLVSVLTLGTCAFVMSVIGLIEGILYLTKSEQEFYDTYMVGRKEWF